MVTVSTLSQGRFPLRFEDGTDRFSELRKRDRCPILEEQALARKGLVPGPGPRLAGRFPEMERKEGSPWASGGYLRSWLEACSAPCSCRARPPSRRTRSRG